MIRNASLFDREFRAVKSASPSTTRLALDAIGERGTYQSYGARQSYHAIDGFRGTLT